MQQSNRAGKEKTIMCMSTNMHRNKNSFIYLSIYNREFAKPRDFP